MRAFSNTVTSSLDVQTWLGNQDEATVAALVKSEGAESVQGLKDSVRVRVRW